MKKKAWNKMGCGCDMGCDCAEKLGQTGQGAINPLWFVLGAGAGVGIWYLLSNMGKKGGPGETTAAAMPKIAPPSRFANLDSVALRLDQLKTLFRSGQMSPEQAYAEADGLITAANGFSLQEGERVSEVVSAILAFQVQIEDYLKLTREAVPSVSASPRVSAFA